MSRIAMIDFNNPVNGKEILCTMENIVRIMVENNAIEHVGHRKVRITSNPGYLDMIVSKRDWEDEHRPAYFHRSYYYPKSEGVGITVRELMATYGWTILPRE